MDSRERRAAGLDYGSPSWLTAVRSSRTRWSATGPSSTRPAGRRLVLEVVIAPGAHGPPEHIHPLLQERFRVISGRVGARVEGREGSLGPDETLVVPAGAAHTWWGDAEVDTHDMVEVEPALETEAFFETIYGLARDGKVGANGQPHPLQVAVLLAGRHRGETYLARPPVPVQKVFAAIAAPIGRLLGYRDRYPEYTST